MSSFMSSSCLTVFFFFMIVLQYVGVSIVTYKYEEFKFEHYLGDEGLVIEFSHECGCVVSRESELFILSVSNLR